MLDFFVSKNITDIYIYPYLAESPVYLEYTRLDLWLVNMLQSKIEKGKFLKNIN